MNTHRLLAQSLTVVLLGTLFIPLVKVDFFLFPFITGKNFLFRTLVEVALALWLILALRDCTLIPRCSPLMWAVFFWIIAVSLSTFFGVNPYRSFWSNYERMEGLVTFLHLGAFFFLLISVFKKESDWRRFFNTSLLVSFGVSLYALLQWFGVFKSYQSVTRLEATLGNSAYLAVYLLFHVALALLVALWRHKERKTIYPYLGLASFHAVILFLTQTRGTLLGLLAGSIVALILFAWTERGVWRKRSIVLLGALVVLVGIFIAARNTSFVQNNQTLARFANISLSEATTASRFTIWQMGWEGFKERPLLGWGPENYTVVFNKYYEPSLWRQEPWFDRAHNVFLDWLVMGGILGLVSYLSLFGVAIFLLYKAKEITSAEKNILTAIGVGYFVHNIFVFDNITSYLLFFGILGFIYFRTKKEQTPPSWYRKVGQGLETIVIPLIIALLFFSLYFFVWRGAYTSNHLISAFSTNSVEEVLSRLEKTFQPITFGAPEATEQLITLTLNVITNQNISDEIKKSFVALANKEALRAMDTYRNTDARQKLLYASFLNRIGELDQALAYSIEARRLSPQKQQIMFEQVGIYGNRGELDRALAAAKEAFLLDESYPEARRVYALVLIFAGREKEAEALLRETKEFIIDRRFVQAYLERNRAAAGLAFVKSLEEEYGTVADLYYIQASFFMTLGNKNEAVGALEKALELNPNQKEETEALIAEIKNEDK